MSEDPDYLNRAFAKETGSHPSGAQPQNPVPGATASQFRWLSGEIEKINKQIQSIHQKLGGKEGHTITSLSLQNYYDIREIARLNDAIHHLEQQLHQCDTAYKHQAQVINDDTAQINGLSDMVTRLQNGSVVKAAGEKMEELKEELKKAAEKIEKLELEKQLNARLTASRLQSASNGKSDVYSQTDEECHKISLKF